MILSPAQLAFGFVAMHFVLDFPLQGDTVAVQKSPLCNNPLSKLVPWPYWLTAHALSHGAGVLLLTGYTSLALAETVVHWVTDYFKCLNKISIHTDQGIHLFCKVAYFVAIVKGL